jgi:hypothetical protein
MGKLRERLIAKIQAGFAEIGLGWEMEPDHFFPVKGWFRSSRYSDSFRWEAIGTLITADGRRLSASLASYSPMTLCAARGVTVSRDRVLAYNVDARAAKLKEAGQ